MGERTNNTQDTEPDRKPTPLFREAAIRHRTRALFGDVVLAAPLASWLLTVFLVSIVGAALAVLFLVKIDMGETTVPLWRWVFLKPS